MRKVTLISIVMLVVAGMLLSACAPAATPAAAKKKIAAVLDTGGENDKSFNQYTLQGAKDAAAKLGFDMSYVVSASSSDYEKNIETFVSEKADMIITVGFLMGDATAAMAKKYPNIKFAIIDVAYFPTAGSAACPDTAKDCYADGGLTNVTSLMFQEDQVGYEAGVLAGCMSKSGTVATVSGMEIPPVVRYVVGFQNGAKSVNPNVKTLNIYIPNFNDPTTGKQAGADFVSQGADVVFGVGGNTGNGGLLAAKEKGLMAIGVDVDQYNTYPEVKDALITSAQKNMDVATNAAVTAFAAGTLKAGIQTGNAANGGIGLAPYHDWDSKISADCKAKVDAAVKGLKDGSVQTGYKP
ncbi:MAG TPA: BMP family ABC transporter substrate-binding protein [Anaerolineae bacterium]|nr:BMP family ABC transporter substrate-binding protein [Anaerolineae bacterium]